MLTEHLGLMVFLLFSTAKHADLLDALSGRTIPVPWWKLVLLIGPATLIAISDFVATEARSRFVRRAALWTTTIAAAVHLALDLACFAMVRWVREAPLSMAATALSMIVAAVILRFAVRAIVADELIEHPKLTGDIRARSRTWALRIEREAWLWGGTSLSMSTVSLALVAMAIVAMVRRPERWSSLLVSAGFFGLCAAFALHTGWRRRRLLLGTSVDSR